MPLLRSDFQLPGQTSAYHGKVRDMYSLDDGFLFRNPLSTGLLACPLKRWTLKGFIMQETTRKTEEDAFRENFNFGLCAALKI